MAQDKLASVDIYSDLICPWCYIGKRRFERGLELSGLPERVQIRWKPFELNPSMPAEGMDRRRYRIQKFGSWEYSQRLDAQVEAAAAAEKLEFNYAIAHVTPNTLKGHLLIKLAAQHGKQDQVVEALFAAYFSKGVNVGDQRELIRIGLEYGLPQDGLDSLFESDIAKAQLKAELQTANALRIQSVPTFVINGQIAFAGAQSSEIIAEFLRAATQ